jgi:hypothetical protein
VPTHYAIRTNWSDHLKSWVVDPLLPRCFDLVAAVTSKSAASHSHLQRHIRLHLDIHLHCHVQLHDQFYLHVQFHLHVHLYVWISLQVHIHLHILAHTPGIVFLIFLFRLCFLFFFIPLHLHPHSSSQVRQQHYELLLEGRWPGGVTLQQFIEFLTARQLIRGILVDQQRREPKGCRPPPIAKGGEKSGIGKMGRSPRDLSPELARLNWNVMTY